MDEFDQFPRRRFGKGNVVDMVIEFDHLDSARVLANRIKERLPGARVIERGAGPVDRGHAT